ncbi:MAG: hypothetical protein HOO91_05330 [Bacteroidales bacterium]|nr:hypothetical protein [Bacteroidales bacterium]
MKRIRFQILLIALGALFLASCEKNEDKDTKSNATNIAYIVNYGSYSGSKSEISIYNMEDQTITHNAYKTANSIDFNSNIQSMVIYNDIAYLMSNDGDKIDIVDAETLLETINPISTNIIKPRYFAATGNTAYVSCWGNVDDWSTIPNSYIAKINLTTKTVTKIPLPGGPEGVIIVNNKLYAGLTTTNKVAVVDLTTEAISYIQVSAVPQQFVQDANNSIWVSLTSQYSSPFPAESLGLAVINPQTNTVTNKIDFTGIGSSGYIHQSSDKKTIYVMGSEPWPGTTTTIYTVNTVDKTLSSTALISGENFYGFNVNPENDNIYVLISPNATTNGTLKVYDKLGILLDEETTGISPQCVVFYNIIK